MGSVLVLLLAMHLVSLASGQIPMSPCVFGRATTGYRAPTATGGNVGGTCGYAPAQAHLPAWFAQRYVAAPDDETYNGYPWLGPPVNITGAGVGASCGECFELTGDVGTITVMQVDVCDKGCCSNCQGSQGGPKGGPDLPDFDVDMAVFSQLSSGSGDVPIAYRKVSCNMGSLHIGLYMSANETTFMRFTPYAHIVGVKSLEALGSATGGTGGQWTELARSWLGWFEWSGHGDIGAPFQLRLTSILGDVITFPGSYEPPYASFIDSGQQFPAPPPGYGGASGSCTWPGPDPDIFEDGFGGPPLLQWRDWGSYTDTFPIYNQTTGCLTAPCIRIPPTSAYKAIQIGVVVGAPVWYWSNVTFWIRTDDPVSLSVYYTGDAKSTTISATATWTQISILNTVFFPSGGTMQVFQIQTKAGGTTADLFIDDIQWTGQNYTRLYPIIGGLNGPPPVGDFGYCGLDPLTDETASTCNVTTLTNTAAATTTAAATGTSTAAASTTAVTSTAFAAGGVSGTSTAAMTTTLAATGAGSDKHAGHSGGLKGGAIAGIVVGVIGGLVLIGVVAFLVYKFALSGASSGGSAGGGRKDEYNINA